MTTDCPPSDLTNFARTVLHRAEPAFWTILQAAEVDGRLMVSGLCCHPDGVLRPFVLSREEAA